MAEDATKDTRKVEDLSFKEASVELEQIVRSLEAGDLELEESLERYGQTQTRSRRSACFSTQPTRMRPSPIPRLRPPRPTLTSRLKVRGRDNSPLAQETC